MTQSPASVVTNLLSLLIILTHLIDCVVIIERILENMKKPFNVNEKNLTIEFSTGIAVFPDDADNADELLSAADSAMYKAKKDPSLKYTFYRPQNPLK